MRTLGGIGRQIASVSSAWQPVKYESRGGCPRRVDAHAATLKAAMSHMLAVPKPPYWNAMFAMLAKVVKVGASS